ncbi:general substrate transporter [Coniophora puteana RWD-64-598 SS2]|uniref:General substrate transporter n=1 Tax=Coniophora puteana (strain RWD-64-598) TaxID=741705 RepID=A0A5M3MW37_CONPW|nr:general substrate transporter [Coniophora puteana RWD-64-598 SS2]EIW83368.1 general substrate transporter [Coniophora puteana RWD-64-598 SS2]
MGAGPAIVSEGSASYAHLIDQRPWYKNSRIVLLNCFILLMQVSLIDDDFSKLDPNFEGSMMNGLQSLTQWNEAFNYPTGGQLGLLTAIQNIGSLCAYPFSPYVTDHFGRRKAIIFGASLMVIATIIQTASQNVRMFIGARWLIGFGLTFAAGASPLLVTEIAYPSQRAQLTSMYNTIWYLGSIIAAWTTFGTFNIPNSWAWRAPSALQGLPSVLQVLLLWMVPESPRWLVGQGKEEEALRVLAYYHAKGNEHDPLVEYEFEEIKTAIRMDRESATNVGWVSLFKTPGNRKRVRVIVALAFFSQWSGSGLVSYYLNKVFDAIGITDPTTQLLINGILSIYNFIVAVAAGFCCDKVGRRRLFLISCAGMVIFWTAQTICFAIVQETGNPMAGHGVIAFICESGLEIPPRSADQCYQFCGMAPMMYIAFTPLIVSYTVEILPYQIRAKGFVLFNFVLSLSLIFNQYVNPIALEKLQWKYYLVYLFWDCFEFFFCWLYIVETKNKTLEETAAMFDGEETLEKIAQEAAVNAGIAPVNDEKLDEKETHSETEVIAISKSA